MKGMHFYVEELGVLTVSRVVEKKLSCNSDETPKSVSNQKSQFAPNTVVSIFVPSKFLPGKGAKSDVITCEQIKIFFTIL